MFPLRLDRSLETQLQGLLEVSEEEACDASSSGIKVIEINTIIAVDNQTSVLDTGCGFHLFSSMKELRSSKKVNKGDIDLRVVRVAALFVGLYRLCLSSGLVLISNN